MTFDDNSTRKSGKRFTQPRLIRKQLTSTPMFHTPGLFRALQNDFRIKGKTRRRAIAILSDGYRLSPEEAHGLLSGSIPVKIDEVAGTVTYQVCRAAHDNRPQSTRTEGSEP